MAARLPMLKTRDVIRILKLLGFFAARQSGSHIFFKHSDGRTTVVLQHGGADIGRGLLRAILSEIEIDSEEFLKHLS